MLKPRDFDVWSSQTIPQSVRMSPGIFENPLEPPTHTRKHKNKPGELIQRIIRMNILAYQVYTSIINTVQESLCIICHDMFAFVAHVFNVVNSPEVPKMLKCQDSDM